MKRQTPFQNILDKDAVRLECGGGGDDPPPFGWARGDENYHKRENKLKFTYQNALKKTEIRLECGGGGDDTPPWHGGWDNNLFLSTRSELALSENYLKADETRLECGGGGDDPPPEIAIRYNLYTKKLAIPESVYTHQLDDEHWVLFNPLSHGGVVVVDRDSYDVWTQFKDPTYLASIDSKDLDYYFWAESLYREYLLVDEGDESKRPEPIEKKTLSAWLHITNSCNLSCGYCYIQKTKEEMNEKTAYASVDAIIRSAIQNNFSKVQIKFSGGEASLNYRLLIKTYEYAKEQVKIYGLGLSGALLSNGVYFNDRLINYLQENDLRVMISLDGTEEVHDQIRHFSNGNGSFKHIIGTIKDLLNHGIVPFISITVSNLNVQHLSDTVNYLLELDIPFNINFFREPTEMSNLQEWGLKQKELIENLNNAFEEIGRNFPTRSLLGILDHTNLFWAGDQVCGVGESYMAINQKGQISKCHMALDKPLTNIHSIDPLLDIKNDTDGLQNLPVDEREDCATCLWRYRCQGGCSALTYNATGRYDLKSPYCETYLAVLPKLVRLEGYRLLSKGQVLSAPNDPIGLQYGFPLAQESLSLEK